MKKILPVLFFTFFTCIASVQAQTRTEAAALKREYMTYRKFIIANDSVKTNWLQVPVGFNNACDTVFFQQVYYSVPKFNRVFKEYVLSKSAKDTVVMQLQYGDDIQLRTLVKSFRMLADPINKYKGHGMYYFAYNKTYTENVSGKTDTLHVSMNNRITYNGTAVKKEDLSAVLKSNKPARVIVYADPDMPAQELYEILETGNELTIKMILQSK